jgi:PhzF family phenazine biosynthesis protein
MEILRYVAFSADASGGNPAGVVLDATAAGAADMLAVAARLGYSETAFVTPRSDGELDVRYFSPLAEVPFCGHATIAIAIAHAERHGTGTLVLHTGAGTVPVTTTRNDGALIATLTSVEPRSEPLPDVDLDALLDALGWAGGDLDAALPPRVAYAGALHPIVAVTSRARLTALDYDFDRLGGLMAERGWTTIDLVHRASTNTFYARNPFPPGGVVEDPATGAAAAAFGGYLREVGAITAPATITVHQGDDMGRPSVLTVAIPASGGIRVSGTATRLTDPVPSADPAS